MNRTATMAICVGLAMAMPSVSRAAATFYVAADGNDAWSGRLAQPAADKNDGPVRTLEQARDNARRLRASGSLATGVTVVVRAGVYPIVRTFSLDPRDSGTPESPTIYQAYPGETVLLVGGPSVPAGAFKPVTDSRVLQRLDSAARGHVVQADLHALGIGDVPGLPVKYQGAAAAPELFCNGRRMTVARWPNEGWTTIAEIIAPGSCPRVGDKGKVGGVFEYSGERPSRWNVASGVWLHGYWCCDWYTEVIQVKQIDREKRQITLAAPSIYSVQQGNPSPRRYYALNLIEELDSPGEYFIDAKTGLLYFWPPAPLASARVVLSTLKGPVVAIHDAHDVVFRGFTVKASLADGIDVVAGRDVCVQACEIRNTAELGVSVSGGRKNRVEDCDIHDTGTGGIVLSGGDRRTLTPADHEAVNNHIWRFSALKQTYSLAIVLQGVGNRAAHNLIHDVPHEAIGIVGNDHVFEYNVIHHVCTETDDSGALHKGRNPSCRGNTYRYNFWYDIGRPMGHGTAAVYFDDGDGGDTVFGNVFLRCGDPGRGSFGTIFSHGGHDNRAENNIFIACKRALGSAPWPDRVWKDAINGGQDCFWTDRLLKEVDISKPPYTTRYPELIGFMDAQLAAKRVNRAVRNVLVNCGEIKSGNWQVDPKENWTTDRDPGFVAAAKGDFRLTPNAEAFSKLSGFQAIPFEKIGLEKTRFRPTLPHETPPAWAPKP
ncbi:MAG: right-handed parallel beta-helix repeat-containing protein [Thermoguttaceae bacterium]